VLIFVRINCSPNDIVCTYNQWRRNEFESGGHRSKAKMGAPIRRQAPVFFCRAPPLFGSKSTVSRLGGGTEIARPNIASPDKTAPDQTARLNNGGHEQSSP